MHYEKLFVRVGVRRILKVLETFHIQFRFVCNAFHETYGPLYLGKNILKTISLNLTFICPWALFYWECGWGQGPEPPAEDCLGPFWHWGKRDNIFRSSRVQT